MEKNINDYYNFGTYNYVDYNALKQELQKQGIPVKTNLAGTNLGTDALGGAQWGAYTLFIPLKCFPKATEIVISLNITPMTENTQTAPASIKKNSFWRWGITAGAAITLILSGMSFFTNIAFLFSDDTIDTAIWQLSLYFALFYLVIFCVAAFVLYKLLKKPAK
ncbi:MAG: hypothetical protein PHG23_01105 [Candidatus Pacebacteria bacterium]|nr:hypothetical protein [Candidatus Paceibacterota bacterium]